MKELFDWEHCGIRHGYDVYDFIKQDDKGVTTLTNTDIYKPIILMNSEDIPVRPKKHQIVVLFEIYDDSQLLDKVWIHFPMMFKKLFEKSLSERQ